MLTYGRVGGGARKSLENSNRSMPKLLFLRSAETQVPPLGHAACRAAELETRVLMADINDSPHVAASWS